MGLSGRTSDKVTLTIPWAIIGFSRTDEFNGHSLAFLRLILSLPNPEKGGDIYYIGGSGITVVLGERWRCGVCCVKGMAF